MRQYIISAPKKNTSSKLMVFLMSLPIFFIMILGITSVVANGQTVGDGAKLRSLETEYQQMVMKERDLESSLSKTQSLVKLKEEAERLGYVPVVSVQYIGLVTPVASR